MKIRLFLWTLFTAAVLNEIHHKSGGMQQDFEFQNLIFLSLTFICVGCLCLITETIKNKFAQFCLTFVYAISFFYFYRFNFPLSFSTIHNNYYYFLKASGLILISKLAYSNFFATDIFWSLIFSTLSLVSYKLEEQLQLSIKQKRIAVIFATLTICFISILSSVVYEPVSWFVQSTYEFYFPRNNILEEIAHELPTLPQHYSSTQFNFDKKPNIFLVIVESFNSRFVNQKTENGTEILPYFNQLAQTNLYFSNYYSNSIQTAKGQFSALCGQIPELHGIEFTKDRCFKNKCLASILSKQGYQTHFIQADPNFNTDNTQRFMQLHGFQNTPELVEPCYNENKKNIRCYNIGIHDSIFYQRAFKYLKQDKIITDSRPLFTVIATVATHMPFSSQYENERALYKQPKNFKENYLNTIRIADDGFRELISQFESSPWAKNSILIITGDHGFPTGEHNSIHNDSFAYQENFGVPLLIIDKRQNLKEKFSHIENKAFSHLNLGLTVLDLAQLKTKTDFIAPSVFDTSHTDSPIYFVQPYSGGFQASIIWPYKYIFSELREKESVFNLATDPLELNPIRYSDKPSLFNHLRMTTAQIYKQQDNFNCNTHNTETLFNPVTTRLELLPSVNR